eukprot:1154105-Pelagomonas_calceolata.AAC.7
MGCGFQRCACACISQQAHKLAISQGGAALMVEITVKDGVWCASMQLSAAACAVSSCVMAGFGQFHI